MFRDASPEGRLDMESFLECLELFIDFEALTDSEREHLPSTARKLFEIFDTDG